MKLENVKLSELKPLENNVRKHNDKQIEELQKSVDQFGQTRAMVIDEDNNILIGNGLYYALVKMGKEEGICYRKTGLTEIEKKKLILSDNKTYSLGADDYNEINNYIQDITSTGDFEIAGFDKYILEQMVATDEEIEKAIEDYGTITDDSLNENQVERSNTSINTNMTKEDTPNIPEPKSATIITETKTNINQDKKYIMCPSCGEVIYLD